MFLQPFLCQILDWLNSFPPSALVPKSYSSSKYIYIFDGQGKFKSLSTAWLNLNQNTNKLEIFVNCATLFQEYFVFGYVTCVFKAVASSFDKSNQKFGQ